MVALLAADRAAVRLAYQTALEHGGTDEGAPGLRPEYHPHYYGTYFRDPEGNKLCVACHAPPPLRQQLFLAGNVHWMVMLWLRRTFSGAWQPLHCW